MMKKIIAICLVLMMLMTAATAEGVWADGLSPQKPYSGSPEVDFNKSIGYMVFMPLTETELNPGSVVLQIFMPRADVQAGEGTFYLYDEKIGLIEEIPAISEKVTCRDMTADELAALIWGSGCVFEIAVEAQLEANHGYYVHMTENCIVSEIYGTTNVEIDDKETWSFRTSAENYVESLTYFRTAGAKTEPVADVQVGDSAKLNIVLGEEGAAAAIYCDAGYAVPELSYITESGETTVNFPYAGEVRWGIIFMNAEGAGIYAMNYVTNVAAAE